MSQRGALATVGLAVILTLALSACGAGSPTGIGRSGTETGRSTAAAIGAVRPSTATGSARVVVPLRRPAAAKAVEAAATIPSPDRPVIVLDPGHSRTIHRIDRKTGLNVSDYENEPEMRDVFRVALLVRSMLEKAGYRVVMTKKRVDQRVDLATRARIANRAHAALALSIHDQAGPDGGIGFRRGNNIVYYQSVGTYRATPGGKRVHFRNKRLAAISKRYGKIFRRQREDVLHAHVRLQGNVGYNLGTRGLAPGDIWMVQLLSRVPWIYNESGGNSAGRSGLDKADRHTYARELVDSVERCVPPPKR